MYVLDIVYCWFCVIFVFLAFSPIQHSGNKKIVTFYSPTLYTVELGYDVVKGAVNFVSL
jgi:hypothetical protein